MSAEIMPFQRQHICEQFGQKWHTIESLQSQKGESSDQPTVQNAKNVLKIFIEDLLLKKKKISGDFVHTKTIIEKSKYLSGCSNVLRIFIVYSGYPESQPRTWKQIMGR